MRSEQPGVGSWTKALCVVECVPSVRVKRSKAEVTSSNTGDCFSPALGGVERVGKAATLVPLVEGRFRQSGESRAVLELSGQIGRFAEKH